MSVNPMHQDGAGLHFTRSLWLLVLINSCDTGVRLQSQAAVLGLYYPLTLICHHVALAAHEQGSMVVS